MSRHHESIDDALIQAMREGTLGWQGKLSEVAGQALVAVRAPMEAACDWVVTLTAMKLGTMTGGPGQLVAGVPLDNQVRTFIPTAQAAPEAIAYKLSGLYIAVAWGMGNVLETAYVSYPWSGSSFRVHGASVLVNLPQAFSIAPLVNGDGVPIIGGMVSPRAGRDASIVPPTLHAGPVLFGVGAQVFKFFRPPRAMGYRLWTRDIADAFAPAPVYTVSQLNWQGGATHVDSIDSTNADPYGGEASNALDTDGTSAGNAWQRVTRNALNWTPLKPTSIALQVAQSTADAVSCGVEWLLDLG